MAFMRPAIAHQNWRQLLFIHWEVPVATLRALVPPELELDLWEEHAYVAVVPFWIFGTRARFLPLIPGTASFYEVNVRTYVRTPSGESGVWFFSLDASNVPAVIGARAGWRLPYFWSRAESWVAEDGVTHYRSERRAPGPAPARLDLEYKIGESIGTATPGTIEHFFAERYLLFTRWSPVGMLVGQVRHHPYPLHRAEVLKLECETLANAAGFPGPSGPVHTLYSPGVDVDILALRRPRL
jgi:uncharacterized protein